MPKILSRDPAGLSTSSPGFDLFQPSDSTSKAQHTQAESYGGPSRRIAHRGTEIFAAVGHELRWSDLGLLQDLGEEHKRKQTGRYGHESHDAQSLRGYKVLKTPAARPITHLTISPSGSYIAILTTHTIHVCILPPGPFPNTLRQQDTTPLKLKSFQIGPTAHVLEQSPLVTALWHPLSPTGNCLVTITHDACVRQWELDSSNRSTFDEPSLAVDLKKLANATSSHGVDFSASKYGTNKGFSPDDVEMQVAGACFGGSGREDEHGWAGMTLWVAMTEGDVYALCPFLPARWVARGGVLGSLSTSVLERHRALQGDVEVEERERRVMEGMGKWLAEVDAQEPLVVARDEDGLETVDVYSRPKGLSAVPKLQGPFAIAPEPDFGEITDIHVIAAKVDDAALYDDDYAPVHEEEGLSATVICLATSTNEVHICLDISGVEPEWLLTKRSRAYTFDDSDEYKELILFETIDLASSEDDDDGCPTFTASPHDRYELFVTHSMGVCSLSFKPWISQLEDELISTEESGSGFRLNVLLDSTQTLVERVVYLSTDPDRNINTAIAIPTPGTGLTLLTSSNNAPYATILDTTASHHPYAPTSPRTATAAGALPAPEPRAPYRPAAEFSQPSQLPRLARTAHEKNLLASEHLKSQIRFSPATLQLLTEAHRIMSSETHALGRAAADLFRRCERMRAELLEQVRKVAEVSARVEMVAESVEDGEEEDEGAEGTERIDERIIGAQRKTVELNERVEGLRRKIGRLGGGGKGAELSAKERVFAEEVARLEGSVLSVDSSTGEAADDESPTPKQKTGSLSSRFEAVGQLQQSLVKQANDTAAQRDVQEGAEDDSGVVGRGSMGVGSEFRRQKLGQVMSLLERETALVEAVMERLRRLQGS